MRRPCGLALEAEHDTEVPARWTEGSFAMRGLPLGHLLLQPWRTGRARHAKRNRRPSGRSCRRSGGPTAGITPTPLWNLRGILDRMVGGVGRRRGRRHPTELRVGDTLDFWRVVAVEPGRRLTLLAEMRLPGTAGPRIRGASRSRRIPHSHLRPLPPRGCVWASSTGTRCGPSTSAYSPAWPMPWSSAR